MHNVLIIFYIAFSIGNLFILPELYFAPSFCFPTTKSGIEGWLEQDNTLSADLDYEGKVMDEIYEHLKVDNHPLSTWFYAHFHASKVEYISGIRFQLLNILELMQVR